MKAKLLSSLNKIFRDTEPNFKEFGSFSCLKNENFSFQLALKPETTAETEIKVSVESELKGNIKIYSVKNMPCEKNGYDNSDNFHYDLSKKEFPDLLEPVSGKITAEEGEWSALWFEYTPEADIYGEKEISIELTAGNESIEKVFTLNIINALLPKQELLYTNWFHNDCICTYYGIEAFSDEYWRIIEKFIKNAASRGMNMILTPVFTPPLDTEVGGERPTVQLVGVEKSGKNYSFDFTNFRKYIKLCLDNGIEAFEISHLFTQWGATAAPKIVATVDGKEKRIFGWETNSAGEEYTEFLEEFAEAFKKEVELSGIKERCWLHVSDEPSQNQINDYKKAADTIHRLFPGFHTFDALSDIEYYRQGLIKTPVCAEGEADVFKAEAENFWTYHCCGQVDKFLPNRMFSQPSQRNRVLGVLLYKYDAKGFLQWGHNFWYSQYSKYPIDPFKVTDAGNAFPSGDAFVVYPGENGEPLNSLRNLVFADALQDLRALKLLETLTTREYVLKLIEEGLDIPLSFQTYPHEQKWLLDLRDRINKEIAAAV